MPSGYNILHNYMDRITIRTPTETQYAMVNPGDRLQYLFAY